MNEILKWTVGGIAVAAVIAALLSGVAGQETGRRPWKAPAGQARRPNPVAADTASIAAGRRVYQRECRPCHGDSGVGDGPKARELEALPGNLPSREVQDQTDGALFWKITQGRRPMASYRRTLSDTDRWHVVNYVRTLRAREGR